MPESAENHEEAQSVGPAESTIVTPEPEEAPPEEAVEAAPQGPPIRRKESEEESTDLTREEEDEILKKHWVEAIDKSQVRTQGRDVFATIELPGGVWIDDQLVKDVVIREMSGRQDMLLMEGGAPGESLLRLAIACVTSIGDVDDRKNIAKILRGPMLIGDFSFLLMKIRQLSVGDKISFEAKCQRCGEMDRHRVFISKLESMRPSQDLHPEDRLACVKVDRFDTGAGWEFHWHWMTQGDSIFLNRLVDHFTGKDKRQGSSKGARSMSDLIKTGLDPMSAAIMARLDRVLEPLSEDAEGNPFRTEAVFGRSTKPRKGTLSIEESVKYIRELPTAIRIYLWNELDKLEPGVETEVEYACAMCKAENSTVIHPSEPNFFFPSEIEIG